MEITNVVGPQFLLPVGLVIVCVLFFVFGIKLSAEPPSFKRFGFSSEDKKSQKKKKIKDKKSQSNGHAVLVGEGDSRKEQPIKALKQSNKNESGKTRKQEDHGKKQDGQKSALKQDKKQVKKLGKENTAEVKTKKTSGKGKDEKPNDFDDGKWETAVSKKDKKNKKKDEVIVSFGTPDKKTNKKKEQDKKQENVAQSPKKSKSPKGQKNVPEKQIEVELTPTGKGQNNQGSKKSKKASAIDKNDENVPVIKDAGKQSAKKASPEKKPGAPKSGKTSEPLKERKNVQESPKVNGSTVDGTWKEASQKSKKKLRKD